MSTIIELRCPTNGSVMVQKYLATETKPCSGPPDHPMKFNMPVTSYRDAQPSGGERGKLTRTFRKQCHPMWFMLLMLVFFPMPLMALKVTTH